MNRFRLNIRTEFEILKSQSHETTLRYFKLTSLK